MTNEISVTDYHWLTGPDARQWLDELTQNDDPLHKQIGRLRRDLSPERTHLVAEQVQLRKRAQAKFVYAGQMFFTQLGLEQATDQWVAAYKAGRFAGGQQVADLCCGIGGDLLGLAARGPTVGVDLSPVHAVLAEANCQILGLDSSSINLQTSDVQQVDLANCRAWHIDPDRRPQGRRTTKVVLHEPGPTVIELLLQTNPQAAIKLAPGAQLPDSWCERAHLEWISRAGQCRQLVAWFGDLEGDHGSRSATLIRSGELKPRTLKGLAEIETPPADRIGRYVYEPDPAVLAAGLTGALAQRYQFAAIAPGHAYLTSDHLQDDPLMTCFEVTDVLPYQPKRLKRMFRQRGIGRLEVKKRGVAQDPAVLQKQLCSTGNCAATLLLAKADHTVMAIVARRID